MSKETQEQMTKVLIAINNNRTKANKQTIMTDNRDTPYVKEAIKYLLDPYEMVGISTKKMNKDIEPKPQIDDFNDLLIYLHEHPTGRDEDIAIVKGYLELFDGEPKRVLSDIITKNLTIGVSPKSANKAYGDGFIRIFEVQLAFPYEKKIKMYGDDDKFYVTQKLDGHRALTTCETTENGIFITTYTRRGQAISGLTELHQDLFEFIKKNIHLIASFKDGIAFDGELLLRNDNNLATDELFRATSKVLRSNGEKKNLEYNIFDVLPLSEFQTKDHSTRDYEYRRMNWLDQFEQTDSITIVEVLDIITKEDIPKWSQYATDHEWEGVMLNAATGLYKKTRSPQILKVKTMHTADLEIVGFNQAIDGKFNGGLQSIIVKLDDENTVPVGSGLTDELRIEIWNNKDDYLGKMVEVQYFEESENAKGEKSLRFPVFKQFRFDKTPEDANID